MTIDSFNESFVIKSSAIQAILDFSRNGIGIIQDGRFIMANKALACIFDFPDPDSMINIALEDILSPTDMLSLQQLRQKLSSSIGFPKPIDCFFLNFKHQLFKGEICLMDIKYRGKHSELLFVSDKSNIQEIQEKLRESEEKYRTIIESSADPILITNLDGNILFANNMLCDLMKAPREQVIGELASKWLIPEDRNLIEGKMKKLKSSSKKSASAQFRVSATDGQIYYLESRSRLITHEGKPVWLSMVRDITEHVLAKRALEDSERTLNMVLKSSPVGIALVKDNMFLWTNETFARMLGYKPGELASQRTSRILESEEEAVRRSNILLSLLQSTGTVEMQTQWIRKDSSFFDCQIHIRSLDPKKPEEGVIIVAVDISERLSAEAAFRQSEKSLRTIFDTVPVGIAQVDEKGTFIAVNRSLLEIFKIDIPQADFIGKYSIRKNPLLLAAGVQHFFDSMLEGKPFKCEVEVAASDFPHCFLRFWGKPILDDAQHVTGAVFIVEDITEHTLIEREKKRLEEQLLQSQKMEAIGRLSGGIAHDFNNLLTGILGNLSMAITKSEPDSPILRHMIEIDKASERAANLTRQLLTFSRKQPFQLKVVDLNWIIDDTEKMLRRLIGEDIELVTIKSPSTALIKADAGQISQVLVTLAVNARDAMPNGGKLLIQTEIRTLPETRRSADSAPFVSDKYVVLIIEDSGIGMTEEVKEKLFEPFFTTKEVGKGTGLGLPTAYGIVRQHQGKIQVDSEQGKGSCFTISFPLVGEVEELPEEPFEFAEIMPRGTETILLVEDEKLVCELNQSILELLGYKVLVAKDGFEAMRVADGYSEPIHLLLTDVIMPGLSGKELAEFLLIRRPDIKVLYTSGYTQEIVDNHESMVEGVNYLQKPYKPEKLARMVRQRIDK